MPPDRLVISDRQAIKAAKAQLVPLEIRAAKAQLVAPGLKGIPAHEVLKVE